MKHTTYFVLPMALALFTACAPEIRLVQVEPTPPAPPPDPGPPRIIYTGLDVRAHALCRTSVVEALGRRGVTIMNGMPAVIRIAVLGEADSGGWIKGQPFYPDSRHFTAEIEAEVASPRGTRRVFAAGSAYAVEAAACSATSERFANAVVDALGPPALAPSTPGARIRVLRPGP